MRLLGRPGAGIATAVAAALIAAAPAHADGAQIGFGVEPAIAVDANGMAHVVWNESKPGETDVLHYCRIPSGQTACADKQEFRPYQDQANYDSGGPQVLLGNPGQVILLTYRVGVTMSGRFPNVVYVSDQHGAPGTFGGPTMLGTNASSGRPAVFDAAESMVVTVSASRTGGTFVQGQPLGTFTEAEAQLSEGSKAYEGTVIRRGPGSYLAAYADFENVYLRGFDCQGEGCARAGINSAANWGPEFNVLAAEMPRLASGPGGTFLMYRTRPAGGGAQQWVVSKVDGTSVATPQPVSALGAGGYQRDFFADQKGALHAAFLGPDGSLTYRSSTDGTAWSAPTVLQPPGTSITAPRVAASNRDGGFDGFAVWSEGAGNSPVRIAALPKPASSARPTALFRTARSAKLRFAKWFSGRTSLSRLKIKRYQWDFGGPRGYDVECGEDAPAVSHAFQRAGSYTVKLRVTDSAGQSAITQQKVKVGRNEVNRAAAAVSFFNCENPGANNQPDRADCVKSFVFSIVDVNGRGGADQCFKLEVAGIKGLDIALPSGRDPARTRAQSFWYRAKIKGPVAINGIYVPIPNDRETVYDQAKGTIGVGTVDVRIGPYHLGEVDLSRTLPPSGPKARLDLGSFDLEKKVPLFGGFKVGAKASLALLNRRSEAKIGVRLPNIFQLGKNTALAQVSVLSNNTEGFKIDGARIELPAVFVGPLLLDKFFLDYSKSKDSWSGGGDLSVPGGLVKLDASPPPPDFGIGIRKGQFDHLGAGAAFEPPAQPQLFPGIGLKHIGIAVGLNPFRLTGTAGISVGSLYDFDGVLLMVFASPSQPYDMPEDPGPELAPLAGRTFDSTTIALGGTASIKVPAIVSIPLVNAYLVYQAPDYFEWGGGFKFGFSFLEVSGKLGGFLAPSQGKFSAEAGLNACLRNIGIDLGPYEFRVNYCAQVGAVVSSKGVGFCLLVPNPTPIGPSFIPAGAGYKWGAKTPDLMIFSCDYGPYRETSPRAAQAGAQTFTVEAGLPALTARIVGETGPPEVTITGPKGERISTSAGPGEGSNGNIAVAKAPDSKATLVAIRQPAAGRWTIEPESGSSKIESVATANGRPAPKIRARVSGTGRSRVLSYDVGDDLAGAVTFSERGARSYRVIGSAKSAKGRIRFSPAPGSAGKRTIVASVDNGAVTSQAIPVASYGAPALRRLGRPGRVRAVRRGSRVLVSWRRVPGATRYYATFVARSGARTMLVSRKPRVTFRNLGRNARGTVFVGTVDVAGSRGPEAKRPVR